MQKNCFTLITYQFLQHTLYILIWRYLYIYICIQIYNEKLFSWYVIKFVFNRVWLAIMKFEWETIYPRFNVYNKVIFFLNLTSTFCWYIGLLLELFIQLLHTESFMNIPFSMENNLYEWDIQDGRMCHK